MEQRCGEREVAQVQAYLQQRSSGNGAEFMATIKPDQQKKKGKTGRGGNSEKGKQGGGRTRRACSGRWPRGGRCASLLSTRQRPCTSSPEIFSHFLLEFVAEGHFFYIFVIVMHLSPVSRDCGSWRIPSGKRSRTNPACTNICGVIFKNTKCRSTKTIPWILISVHLSA